MTKLREGVWCVVTLPLAKVTSPPRMDGNPFYTDELLTAIILIQVILTCRHTVSTGIHADRNQRRRNKTQYSY